MRFAYADPPYLGLGQKFYGHLHPNAADFDKPEAHAALIDRLVTEFPDGWALSLHSPSLRTILPMCPEKARVMAWCKSFAFFKPGVRVAYAWEPLIVMGGRTGKKAKPCKDFTLCNVFGVTARQRSRANPGEGKPEPFCFWLFDVLGAQPGDELADLFPGSGNVTRAWDEWMRHARTWQPRREGPRLPMESQR